jgi:hypothetical protein
MTFEGLGKMLKVILQTCAAENFHSRRWGAEGGSRVRRPGSEDPHRHEWKFTFKVCEDNAWSLCGLLFVAMHLISRRGKCLANYISIKFLYIYWL